MGLFSDVPCTEVRSISLRKASNQMLKIDEVQGCLLAALASSLARPKLPHANFGDFGHTIDSVGSCYGLVSVTMSTWQLLAVEGRALSYVLKEPLPAKHTGESTSETARLNICR